MNSPKCNNLMTTIKLQMQQKNKRKYSNNKQQKNMQYYSLFIAKITTIQRWFRSRLVVKNRKMESKIIQALRKRQYLLSLNRRKHQEIKCMKRRRRILLSQKENRHVINLQSQIQQKVRKALKSTLNGADRLAQNNGRVKYILEQINQCQSKGEQLQGEVEALKFQYNCHRKRKAEWQQKLFRIKENILNQTLKTKDLRTRMTQMQRKPQSSK